ncbi:MAG: TonB-dependent receptor [Bacteroidales bacterium]|nr:TonB-dependent receptor [Bacteroidales bacterium]
MEHTKNSCGRYRFFEVTRISRRQMIACLALALSTFSFQHSALRAQDTVRSLDEVMIQDARVSNKAPLTTSTVDREELDEARAAVSLPFMLETQPSVVASGENGGVGATALRIRGVDGSRINVNINGITLNDAESQEVFWYNIPNLGGMAQSMQIQRGVGASNGGSPAFGAAINMQTLNARNRAYGEADLGFGSWNTRQYSVSAGTGILKSGLSFDFAYSGLTSDGYIRSWGTDQQSFFGSASWYGERTLVKLLAIIGSQTTGITWDGAYDYQLDDDPTYNPSGEYEMDGQTMYYPNETDNYWQRHYQLYVSHLFNDRWSVNAAFDFTHGDGYYEQMKYKKYKNYNLTALEDGSKHNLVTRKYLYNNAYTANLSARYTGERLSLSFGDNFLFYDGEHYGNIIWFRDTAVHLDTPYEWYRNYGDKYDNTLFAKANYDFSDDLNAYADLQLRMVNYKVYGYADDLFDMDFNANYLFFNPKAGVNYRINDDQRTYFVAGISNREPRRSDIKDAIGRGDTIRPETMLDLELGYQIAQRRWNASANLYAMLYRDQMTPNGDVSSSGYALMENVEKSYRLGIELQAGVKVTDWMRMDANLTLSRNKAVDFSYTDFADGDTALQSVTATTDLSLSPSVIGAAIATFVPVENAKLQLIGKYVGKQYADNTSRECYAIDPYFLLNVKASYTWKLKGTNEIEAQLLVNNVLNHQYRLNAWVGDYFSDDPSWYGYYHDRAWLQQPGINFMGRVIYRF